MADIEAMLEAATPEALRRALRIVLGAGEAYWERDFDSGELWYSPTFFRLLGLPPDTLDRERINARIHPDDRSQFEADYAAAVRRGGPFSYDVRYLDAQGVYRWARATGRVWLTPDGRPQRLIGMMSDVHVEKQAQLDARESHDRYRRALDAAGEAHFERIAGQDDFIVSDNLARLLGHPEGTASPDLATFLAWIHPDDRPAFEATFARAGTAEGVWEATCRLRMADGPWRWFRGRGRSERDAAGRIRASGMLGDVHQQVLDRQELDQHRHRLTELVAQRTERLDAALADAERASRAKSEFLAHMSHELRTPLNGVLGLAELALRVAEQPAQRRYLEVALASGRSLALLIDDLLNYSRLDAGPVALADEAYDLAALAAEVFRAQMPSVRAKGLLMRFDWSGRDGTWVRGDPGRVRQVITNLVANAAKFTQQGHVTLSIDLDSGARPARALLRVEDTGPGIATPQQARIFDPFVQADASLTRQHGGAGLGLAIARRLAQAMGGDVVLERSSAKGSSFVFSWPVALAEQPLALPAPKPGLAWLLHRPAAQGAWLAARLRREGWQSELFDSVTAAVAAMAGSRPPPDLVVVNEQSMTEHTDLAALRKALPVAQLALLVRPDWHQPQIEAQAPALNIAIVVVPLTPADIRRLLLRATPSPRRADAPPTPPVALAPQAAAPGATVMVVEDNKVNRLIAESFVRELGCTPVCAEDGATALQACAARPPSLVLMDLQMPVMDGFEVARQMRAQQAEGRLPRFPIVALTAHAGEADREAARSAGMDDYLTKPLLLESLRATLARWIGVSR